MLVVALQAVGSHGAEDGPDTADAQNSRQEADVEQDLLLPRFQLVHHLMIVDVEIFERERHHGQHGGAYRSVMTEVSHGKRLQLDFKQECDFREAEL